ncbi:hypothetical protein ACWDUD_07640 [Rhodococcus sp. NPDC003382]
MRRVARRAARLVAIVVGAGLVGVGGAGIAAADEWPPVPDEPSAIGPYETSGFLTPDNPDFWNPLVARDRLTSPFGTSTRIVCTAFHGVLMDCWQADRDGNPHKLVRLPFNFPAVTGSTLPGGGPGHYVYPGFIPGI